MPSLVVNSILKFFLLCNMCSVKLLVLNGYLLMHILLVYRLNIHCFHPATVSIDCFSIYFLFANGPLLSRAMETVINQHGLDIEALRASRLPLTGGTQMGDSSTAQYAGTVIFFLSKNRK